MKTQQITEPKEGFTQLTMVDIFPGANDLTGTLIQNRWDVIGLMYESKQESGGNFGVAYEIYDRTSKTMQFLKVVDFRKRLRDITQLKKLLNEAEFEIALHNYCDERRMTKVVQMITHGQLVFKRNSDEEEYNFICLILEKGEGDIKSHVDYAPGKSVYWKICVLRDVALAITQLERANLAHNDVKPSNVIRFESKGDIHNIKLGDIGRAVRKDGQGPFDAYPWAGDPRHQPIELFYNYIENEWQDRRIAADSFMLGSLLSYLFVGASITERIINSLPSEYHPGTYRGSYRQILDVIRHTWVDVIHNQVANCFPPEIKEEMSNILKWLTEPDPRLRGDPNARKAGTVGIDRIHGRLVRLAQRAQIQEKARQLHESATTT